MGEPVELPGGGGTAPGYLSAGEGAGPALIVLGDPSGGPDHVRGVCDRFAAEGFTALAPDPQAEPVGAPEAAQRLSRAVDFLVDHPAVRGGGVGVVGFSTGGSVALWLASLRPDRVLAVVPFCGVIPSGPPQPDWGAVTAAVEGHYAEHDDRAGPEAVRVLEEALGERGRDVRTFVYPGTSHAFFDETRPDVYDDDAARQAWVRTLEFLRAKLG